MTLAMTCRRAAAILPGSALAFLLVCAPATAQPDQGFDDPFRAAEYFDANFLTHMIDHHAMAVAMAELCDGRAVHAELQALCTQMAADQNAEVAQMQVWLDQWYGLQHDPVMDDEGMHQLEMLDGATGEDFEIMFMTMMIAHHHGAVKVVVPCSERADHEELADLCAGMHDMQLEEIVQMETWLCEWYGICGGQSPVLTTTWSTVKALHR